MAEKTEIARLSNSFNREIGKLLQNFEPDDMVQLLGAPDSLLRFASNQNQNQNGSSAQRGERGGLAARKAADL